MPLDYATPEYRSGHVAYDSYSASTKGLTHDGRPMPAWRDLGEPVQRAWIAAAAGVLRARETDKERSSDG